MVKLSSIVYHFGDLKKRFEVKSMQATGYVRKLDNLGRIVVPSKIRREVNINIKDEVSIYTDENSSIVVAKYEPTCYICTKTEDLIDFKGKCICKSCIEAIGK